MKFKTPIKVSEISQEFDLKVKGSSPMDITGINEIHMVNEGDITFVDHPKYYEKVLDSDATFIIINDDAEPPKGKTLLVADDPFDIYVSLVKKYNPFRPASELVDKSASVGEGSVIQPGAVIGSDVKIGKGCIIHSGVVIYSGSVIGDNVIIHSNTVIGSDAFYYKRRADHYDKLESCGGVVIEDNVEIGSGCTIDKGVSGITRIGHGTKFDNQIHVGHDTVIGRNCLFAAQVGVAGVVRVEDNVILWGQVGVQKDIVIGEGAVVLAQSGISKSLKGNITYFGSPAREAKIMMKELALIRQLPEVVKNLNEGG